MLLYVKCYNFALAELYIFWEAFALQPAAAADKHQHTAL